MVEVNSSSMVVILELLVVEEFNFYWIFVII